MARKKIRDRTKLCSALLALGTVPYSHAKQMTESQFLSLFQWDHNILHETGHPDRDQWWNLTPMLIMAHRSKTRLDMKVIAKGRRIRAKRDAAALAPAPRTGPDGVGGDNSWRSSIRPSSGPHKLRSRGFDKRFRRKMDGTVVKR